MRSRKAVLLIINVLIVLFFSFSCVKEELDFEKVSGRVKAEPEVYLPLFKGSLTCHDLFEDQFEDSTLLSEESNIYLYLRQDSVIMLNVEDLASIPDQGPYHYELNSGPAPLNYTTNDTYILEQHENFPMTFDNGFRIDSVYLNSGYFRLEMNSNFDVDGALRIRIPSLTINGEVFDSLFYFSRATGDYHAIHNIFLANAVLAMDNSNPDTANLGVDFTIIQEVTAGDVIDANSIASIDLSFIDINHFEVLFGFAGDTTFSTDTIMDIDLGALEGVSGSFAITNPKIYFNYSHSFGIPLAFDLKTKGIFENGDSVVLHPDENILPFSSVYLNPVSTGQIMYSRENVPNIDDFLVFPPPQQISYTAGAKANANGYTGLNWLRGDSKFQLDMEVEVPLEFRANLTLRDTINFDMGDMEDEDYFEYAILHYRIRNEFPVNFDASLILYDSISNIHLDTLHLSDGNGLLQAAPVDANGITIMDQVEEVRNSITLTSEEIHHMLNSNKAIVIAKISTYDPSNVPSVKILDYYTFDFHTSVECKVSYESNP